MIEARGELTFFVDENRHRDADLLDRVGQRRSIGRGVHRLVEAVVGVDGEERDVCVAREALVQRFDHRQLAQTWLTDHSASTVTFF